MIAKFGFALVMTLAATFPLAAEPFHHPYGEWREYHRDWLAACPDVIDDDATDFYGHSCFASTGSQQLNSAGLPAYKLTLLRNRLTGELDIAVTLAADKAQTDFRGLGAVAYLGKTGLEPGMLGDVLDDISTIGFSIRLSKVTMTVPDYFHSALTPREQEIINLMARREPGMSRTQIYEQVAGKLGIDRDSAEKYFKKARAKIMKSDHKLPVGI